MLGYNEKEILEGLKTEDPKIIRYLYKKYFQSIRKMTDRFSNIILEPEDVFQEGLTRTIINIRENKFKGKSTYYTYLFSVCRNICLKEIGKNNEIKMEYEDVPQSESSTDQFDLFNRLFELIGSIEENCRDIIRLRFGLADTKNPILGKGNQNELRFEEIAIKLGLKPDNARQRFKRCLDKLRKMAVNDKDIKEYYSF